MSPCGLDVCCVVAVWFVPDEAALRSKVGPHTPPQQCEGPCWSGRGWDFPSPPLLYFPWNCPACALCTLCPHRNSGDGASVKRLAGALLPPAASGAAPGPVLS